MAWFRLGLTIVDGIDTLMIAGLDDEYQEVLSVVVLVVVWCGGVVVGCCVQ
jgi:hypothetical protein